MPTIQQRRFATSAEFTAALVMRLEAALSGPGAAHTAVMLSGGRTPLPAYRALAQKTVHPATDLTLFYSDDRYVPATAEASNYHQSRPLIDALGLPPQAVLRVRTELPLGEAAADYERQLASLLSAPIRLSLGLLGLGADGHTASLFDAAQLDAARDHLAVAVQRPDGMQGISVTPGLLAHLGEVLFLVAGEDKHEIVAAFLQTDSGLIARRAVAGCANVAIWIGP